MYLSAIHVYPVKSLGGVSLPESKVHKSGLEWDRRWLLVDEEGMFLTQRKFPHLAGLAVTLTDYGLEIQSKESPNNRIQIPRDPDTDSQLICKVWDDEVLSVCYGQEINNWFTNYIGVTCRLVKMATGHSREKDLGDELYTTQLSYADGYPLLVLSKASVAHISREIGQDIDIRQFRANLILDDCEAFSEDSMKGFMIGETSFAMVKPCKRCQVIGIDQDSGKSSSEPIQYLAKTRKVDQHIIFGMNAALLKEGIIKVGQEVK